MNGLTILGGVIIEEENLVRVKEYYEQFVQPERSKKSWVDIKEEEDCSGLQRSCKKLYEDREEYYEDLEFLKRCADDVYDK